MVFQDPYASLNPCLTVRETLTEALAAVQRNREMQDTLPEKIDKMLELTGISQDEADRYPRELSGGQRQALTLLMATLKRPKLLLLDEHTAALDPKTARKVLDLTEEMVAEQHLTALMVTHNMKDAISIGNRLIMMDDGRIIYDVRGDEKKKLTVEDLLHKFGEAGGGAFVNDRMMLSK